MAENTSGPDTVYEGALAPHTEPGETTIATDGAIVPPVPQPVQQTDTDIEALKALYDAEPNSTAKLKTWFRIQDHEAQKPLDEVSAFDELADLGEYKALLVFGGEVSDWMKTEAIEVRNLEESPDLNQEAIDRKLEEGRERRASKARHLYDQRLKAGRKLLKATQPPRLEIGDGVTQTVQLFSSLVPLMTPEDTLTLANRLADSNDPATQFIVPIMRRLEKNPPRHWGGWEGHVSAFLAKTGTSLHARKVLLHAKAKEIEAHNRSGLRRDLQAYVEDAGMKKTIGRDPRFGGSRRARRKQDHINTHLVRR